VQYASADYRSALADHGRVASMSRKGNCYDNAAIEAFWSSLKNELVHLRRFATRADARTAIFDQMTPQHIEFMLSKIPMGRFCEVDEIAAMVAWLASEECAFSTGAVFDLSGGRAVY
jgi:3-oxoacyl-[acyl-carrier protein] reductase